MGTCNCFKISNQQRSLRDNDFFVEEANQSQSIYLNKSETYESNKINNNKESSSKDYIQKFSPRGVNNPTQNNIKKGISNNVKKDSEFSETASNEKLSKHLNEKKISSGKLEDTTDKDNFETFTRLQKITMMNQLQEKNNNYNIKEIEVPLKNNSLVKNQTLNKRLTEILKLKDLSKKLRDKNNSINIVLLGDKCVGKTSIVYQFISNKFDQYYIQTIIKEEFTKGISVNGKKYNLNFTVTSGVREYQEDYTNLYKISDFFVVCYDITNYASFEKAKEIITEQIISYAFLYNERYANIVLLGNKSDLKERTVDQTKVNDFCQKYKIDFYETSAKLKTNIVKVFNRIVDVFDEAISLIKNEN